MPASERLRISLRSLLWPISGLAGVLLALSLLTGVAAGQPRSQTEMRELRSVHELAPGAGYNPRTRSAVRALQRRLAQGRERPGPIDGRYGPLTEAAVARFQADHGLTVDRIAGPLTLAALTSSHG